MNRLSLIELVKDYRKCHEIGEQHAEQLRHHIGRFVAWAGDGVDQLNDDRVNEWLAAMRDEGNLSAKTRKAYRASLIAVWRHAFNRKFVNDLPRHVQSIKVPRKHPEAWTVEEVRRLLAACDTLQDEEADKIRAFIHLSWCTGLRPGDVYDIDTERIGPNGEWYLSQRKTGDPHFCLISPQAVAALQKVGGRLPPLNRHQLSRVFKGLAAIAKVRRGTARWLRRSSASEVEKAEPGSATKFLGHRTPEMATRHYIDPGIVGCRPVAPRPLLEDESNE